MEIKEKQIAYYHWKLVGVGAVGLVGLVQFLAFIQGFYIAVARLNYHQTLIMLRPTFLFATPFYFFMGRWIASREPKRYIYYPCMATALTLLANSFLYYYLYRIPMVYSFDPSIILVYFLVTVLGGMAGKKIPCKSDSSL